MNPTVQKFFNAPAVQVVLLMSLFYLRFGLVVLSPHGRGKDWCFRCGKRIWRGDLLSVRDGLPWYRVALLFSGTSLCQPFVLFLCLYIQKDVAAVSGNVANMHYPEPYTRLLLDKVSLARVIFFSTLVRHDSCICRRQRSSC